jgi:hypothetical protein
MDAFYKHPIYALSHILIGMLTIWYPIIGLLFIGYQILQLATNKRFFLFSMQLKEGNSVKHTLTKLLEWLFGVILGYILLTTE